MKTKKIQNILSDIADKVGQEIEESKMNNRKYCSISYETKDGCIEIETNEHDDIEVFVYHNDGEERECKNIVKAIIDALPCWYDIEISSDFYEDDYEYNGFANEADYIRWKYC